MKIVNLMEDTPGKNDCFYEHGLSFYIETAHHKVLLDTGATDAFLQNAERKGIDLRAVDTVVISHGHYDHAGGVRAFTAYNPRAVIYIHQNAVGAFYNLKYPQPKYIGMDPAIASLEQVVFLTGNYTIDKELSIFTDVHSHILWPKGNETLREKRGDTFVQDLFVHEQYLVVTEGNRQVLLSGCAHNGILNILQTYRALYGGNPTHVISGFHTMKAEYTEEDVSIICQTGEALAALPTVFYSGHCTGEYPLRLLQRIMGEQLIVLHSGDDII